MSAIVQHRHVLAPQLDGLVNRRGLFRSDFSTTTASSPVVDDVKRR